jgi:VanZ family protein
MLSKQESAEVSSSVMDAMEGILRPIVEFVTGGPVDDTLLHKVVRKGAHFAEFAALSALLTVLLHLIFGTWRTHAMGYVLFLSLLFGVLDEFLQSFTGRGTSVRDVMLDLCGALLGIACVITLIEIIKRLRRHQKSK